MLSELQRNRDIVTGFSFAYKSLLEALVDDDQDALHEMCEKRLAKKFTD